VDPDLCERLIEGDEYALGEVYDRYAPVVYGLALRVTRDRLAAEDICQDTFVAVWERPQHVDRARGSLRAWLCEAAHLRAVDWVRGVESGRPSRTGGPYRTSTDDVETRYLMVAQRASIAAALDSLPREQSVALELAYFGGLTYRQVAACLAVPEVTIKSRIRLGLERLAERSGAEGSVLQ
jgi:RNA polymerase sigma factor (sigma-70 family)